MIPGKLTPAQADRRVEEEEPKKKKKHSKRASRLRTDSDITVQQNTYILFIFLLIFLNIMSDQKLSE